VILVDSDIPMYLAGGRHPHKTNAQRLLEKLIRDRQRLVTDTEVLQEIFHRYVAIHRRDAIQPAFDALLGIIDQVLAVPRTVIERAKQIVLACRRLSARDAVHLSVLEQNGIEQILSFDSGFDSLSRHCTPTVSTGRRKVENQNLRLASLPE
jgi:predicted nucleic acid-binding protein